MILYNSLNVKLSNSQLNKLKSAMKNQTRVILKLSSNMKGKSDDATNCCLLIDRLQIFAKLLQIIHQLISSYQKLSYLK